MKKERIKERSFDFIGFLKALGGFCEEEVNEPENQEQVIKNSNVLTAAQKKMIMQSLKDIERMEKDGEVSNNEQNHKKGRAVQNVKENNGNSKKTVDIPEDKKRREGDEIQEI